MIVLDPVRTETAELADFHLRVRPGTDAWCLAALLGVLVQEGSLDEDFLRRAHDRRRAGAGGAARPWTWRPAPQRCGVDEELIRTVARRIADATSVSTFEDLGVQQGPHSVLCSYLNKLQLAADRQLRQAGRDARALLAGAAGPLRHARAPHAGHRRADRRRAGALQRDRRGDPHRPPRPLPRDADRERQPGALAGRLAALPRGARRARAGGRDRRRDDRDRPPRRLRAAGREPVREVGGDVLQPRVPAQHLPPARAAAGAAARARCPSRRSTRASCARWACSTSRRWRRCAPPPRKGARALRGRVRRGDAAPTRASPQLAPYVLYETLGPDAAGRRRRCRRALGPGAPLRDDLPRRGPARRPRRRRGAVRRDPRRALGRHLHRSTTTRTPGATSPTRPAHRARDPRAAGASCAASTAPRRAGRATSSRSCCRPASAARSPPTRSSATRPGASATPRARCGSARRTPRDSASTTAPAPAS